MYAKLVKVALVGLSTSCAVPALAAPSLGPIWGDRAVIQRDRPIVIEGKADAGENVTVTLDNASLAAKADKAGRFAVRFPARDASDRPLTLTVSGKVGETARFEGLVVGDVYLCSGQSNMEYAVRDGLDAWNQIHAAHDDDLRMITIPKAVSDRPLDHFGGAVAWQVTTPETLPDFSAVCYYMAKDLRRRLGIPIGTIHSSWGGSASRPWLTAEGGRAIYGDAEMALLHRFAVDPGGAVAQFAPRWEDWYRKESGGKQPWADSDGIDWLAVPRMSPWNHGVGTPLETNPVGTVWLRRTVELTAAEARGEATLSLGKVDDLDTTWVNGHPVGNTYGPDQDRDYRIPAGVLQPGRNEVIVAVSSGWGDGGLVGDIERLALTAGNGDRVALESSWRYSISPIKAFPPRSPWDRQAGIGVIANAMIAPIGHYALKGVAWYQGESDVGRPGYVQRLKALFAGWRRQFGGDTRMLVVQLANFGAPQPAPTASAMAELREAQREAVAADSNAALVTAIDIGERTDIHPANKQEVGRRLAAAAVGEPLPQPRSAVREGESVRVTFSGVQGALAAWSGNSPLGFELCGTEQSTCRFVSGKAEGDSVILPDAQGTATRVRYAWANSPVVNLYDSRPLTPPAFELPITRK